MKISVQFEDTDLHKILSDMIVHPNKEEYLKLLVPIICESHRASDLFFRLHMGKTLYEIIPKGTLCYVHVEDLGYEANKKKIKNSKLCNEHGKVVCKVVSFSGYHNYCPYTISYSNIKEDDLDTIYETTTSVTIDTLEPFEDF